MYSTPTLSVGLPVFNGARWIEDALESILEQSFGNFELIIADNASTDDTQAICRSVAARDARVRYHRNSDNIGAHRNYDGVLELASGKYFKWASCSDICLQGFFEKCVAVLDARPDVVLAYPKTLLLFSPPGGEEYAREYEDNLNLDDDRPSIRFKEYLNRERLNNVMNGVIRAAVLRQTALNVRLPGSDISMIAELALRGKFVEIPDRLFVRRFDSETTGILMNASSSRMRSFGYPGRPDTIQRVKLHSYRFITTLRAPIVFTEKVRVWIYLLRRIAWLRHQVMRKLARAVSRA
ncbi:MAG: glycosyltransferase family A protein [Betaproteobacteria bacterium]